MVPFFTPVVVCNCSVVYSIIVQASSAICFHFSGKMREEILKVFLVDTNFLKFSFFSVEKKCSLLLMKFKSSNNSC